MKIVLVSLGDLVDAQGPYDLANTGRLAGFLADALAEAGHQVTLLVARGSCSVARVVQVWPHDVCAGASGAAFAPLMLLLEELERRADDFDIVHSHLGYFSLSALARQTVPFLTTVYDRVDLPERHAIFRSFSGTPLVSISDRQRRSFPGANWLTTIPCCLPEHLLQPTFDPAADYVAYVCNLASECPIERAIRIAAASGMRLKIAGPCAVHDRAYFRYRIKPLLASAHVDYVEHLDDCAKSAFYGGARALLVPGALTEPYYLPLVEAMACGTPVIALRSSLASEIIEDGVSGMIADDDGAAVAAILRAVHFPRAAIRVAFERRFSAQVAARAYEQLYENLRAERGGKLVAVELGR
ncbi:glycosyltransferase [Paraburkholderia fynbosensis]|uniref:D-inositol-3-phosphate glycosyltransferase n=1 Tax=Paraburkholderia fynbosensis TaxID=1200993 RepID=A0A6J5H1R4_9BURK|nr:glycosyltransferase [Paraburkholderia fynbosensis]CAB3810875.1 hypothetical protein LMG27177_07552 [Paraburkholderia fynbosensis]